MQMCEILKFQEMIVIIKMLIGKKKNSLNYQGKALIN